MQNNKLLLSLRVKDNLNQQEMADILNISLMDMKAETFLHALEEHEVYVSTNTACASGEISTSVMALYNDVKRASSTLRISFSHLTTTDEINKFLLYFKMVYEKLSFMKKNEE